MVVDTQLRPAALRRGPSRRREKDCVFRRFGHGDLETISEHDPDSGEAVFVGVTVRIVATTLRVTVADGGDGTSAVEVTYVVTPISDVGARFAASRYEFLRVAPAH